MAGITPIFLVSLPRSGSTLLQRLLAVDETIATTTEPWLLLPLLYARRAGGSITEYSHWRSIIAHEDFAKALPGGEDDYRAELAAHVCRLYRAAAGDEAQYFLDKTPRYALIVDDLLALFPDAKFIFLWRNPIAVAASMMNTWAGGRWNLDDYRVDFYRGLPNMIAAVRAGQNRICCVQYEQLLDDPSRELAALCGFLDRPFDASMLDQFSDVKLTGRFGDQTGTKSYATLASQPLDKWTQVMGNPVRRAWCRRYLRWLGRERLAVMGYDMDTLLRDLSHTPRTLRLTCSDAWRHARGCLSASLHSFIANRDATRDTPPTSLS